MHCTHLNATQHLARHDGVKRAIHQQLNVWNIPSNLRVQLPNGRRDRPDIAVDRQIADGSEGTFFTVVSIVDPTAPSHRQRAASDPPSTARTMERTKENHSRSRRI